MSGPNPKKQRAGWATLDKLLGLGQVTMILGLDIIDIREFIKCRIVYRCTPHIHNTTFQEDA